MRSLNKFVCCVVLGVAFFAGGVNAVRAEKVSVENFVVDDVTGQGYDLRVVMVHLETSEKHVFDVKADQKKSIGTLRKGDWAVVITRKVNNKPMYVGGGVASVIFAKTLVALFNMGVDVANDDN